MAGFLLGPSGHAALLRVVGHLSVDSVAAIILNQRLVGGTAWEREYRPEAVGRKRVLVRPK